MRRALALLIAALIVSLATIAIFPELALRGEFTRQRWFAGASWHETRVGDERIVHVEAGRGPLLVLLHGFTGSKENWLPVLPLLSDRYRVVAPDLPGWGESARADGADYGYAAQAERLAAWLDTLGDEPVRLVGHSMGGGIAAVLAASHPERVAQLVLVDAAGVRFRENAFAAAVLRGENPFAVADRVSLDRMLAIVFANPPWVPWPIDRALIDRRIAQAAFEQSVLDRIARGPESFLPETEAPRIAAPTLLLWCNADPAIDISAATVYRTAIPGSELKTLDSCHHMPMMERPADTAAALKEFLQ